MFVCVPGLSVFEFRKSQVVHALNAFLAVDATGLPECDDMEMSLANVKRLVTAGLLFATTGGSSPLQGLVHKLRDAVAALETFPVRHVIPRNIRNLGASARTGSDEARMQNTRLASLGQPLKLKLERHSCEKDLKELPQSQVLVEPLVVMRALEEYLWPRVRPDEDKSEKQSDQQQSQQQQQQGEQSGGSRPQGSGRGRSGVMRRAKIHSSSSKSPSAQHEKSPDSESMSCSHDESEEGGGPFPEDDLFLEEDDEGLDDGLSDEDDFDDEDEDEEDEIEGLSHVHSLGGNSEDGDEMDDAAGPSSSTDRRTYAQRVSKPDGSKIEFCIGGVVIKQQATVFQAIREVHCHTC